MKKIFPILFVLLFSFMSYAQEDEQQKLEKRKEQLQRELEEKRARYLAEKKKEKNVLKEIAKRKG